MAEGKETERGYLNMLLRQLDATAVEVQSAVDIEHAGATHPMGVVNGAIAFMERAAEPYEAVWCVIDVDDHPDLINACNRAESKGVSVAVSNPCFEIWLYWHHGDRWSGIDRGSLQQMLKDLGFVDHKKRVLGAFPIAEYESAYTRSFKAYAQTRANYVGPNPSTSFGKLLDAIRQ